MSFRAISCSVLLASSVALATPPLRLVPFANHCFDHVQLAARLRQHGVTAQLGPSSTQAGQQVQVLGVDALDVRIEARDEAGRVLGLESRHVPEGPCDSSLETVELVIVRAATPLHFIPETTPRPRPHVPKPVERTPRVEPSPVEPSLVEPPPVEALRVDTPVVVVPPPPVAMPLLAAPVLPPSSRRPLRFDLGLHGLWLFPLDGAPSAVAGDVEVAVRWSPRLGVGLRAGVAHAWRSADRAEHSEASIEVRRIPLALLLEVALRLPRGHVQLAVGPLVQVLRVESSGVSQPRTAWTAQPGLEARALYRYDLRRWFVELGLQLDIGLLRQDFVVTGSGTLTHTPVADLSPVLGAGVSF